jgi:hypothetical protein
MKRIVISPQRVKPSTLAAVDEAFQDKIKQLSVNLHQAAIIARAAGNDKAFEEALAGEMVGVGLARKVRAALRKAINEVAE